MKRFIITSFLAAICIVSISSKTHAQSATVRISPELYAPTETGFKVGLGAIIDGEWKVDPKVGLSVGGGVQSFFHKNDRVDNYTFIPLKGGLKYYVDPKFSLGFNLGAAIGLNGYGNDLLVGGGVNYQVAPKIDLGARIEDAGLTYFALRVGFTL